MDAAPEQLREWSRKGAEARAAMRAEEEVRKSSVGNGNRAKERGVESARELFAKRESRRALVPAHVLALGLESTYRELVRLSVLGDRQAASQVFELSGLRGKSGTSHGSDETADSSASIGDPRESSAALLDQLAKDVGEDITPAARRLVAELDLGLGEILRRGSLGLPMSELERTIYEQAQGVCKLRRIDVDVTPKGLMIRKSEPELSQGAAVQDIGGDD